MFKEIMSQFSKIIMGIVSKFNLREIIVNIAVGVLVLIAASIALGLIILIFYIFPWYIVIILLVAWSIGAVIKLYWKEKEKEKERRNKYY
jgi:uncharacterized membrane protein